MAAPVAAQAGCWIPTNCQAWLEEATLILERRNFRADAHAGRLQLLILLTRIADPHSMTVQLSWTWLITQTGKSRSWVADTLSWAHEMGLLVTYEHGSTHKFRPAEYALLHPNEGDRQPVYILTLPTGGHVGEDQPAPKSRSLNSQSVDETWTPTLTPKEVYKSTHARGLIKQPFGPGKTSQDNRGGDPLSKRVRRRHLGQKIMEGLWVLRPLTPQHVASIAKPWILAGWTPGDIRHALDHTPDGQLHPHTAAVRSPAGWMLHRLKAWAGADGTPLPSRSQRAAATAAAVAASQAAARARATEAQLNAADPHAVRAHAERARQLLTASHRVHPTG